MKYDVSDVREVLDRIVLENPGKVDRRPSGKLPPRYLEHGEPACLAGEILSRSGRSLGSTGRGGRDDLLAYGRNVSWLQ